MLIGRSKPRRPAPAPALFAMLSPCEAVAPSFVVRVLSSNGTGTLAISLQLKVPVPVTVGTAIASCPPYRSVRAELPHTAPTLDGWRRSAHQDKDVGHEDEGSIVRRLGGCVSNSAGCAGYDAQASSATDCRAGRGNGPTSPCYLGPRDSGNSLQPRVSAIVLRREPAHASAHAAPL
jgi:hypothetical protein